MLIKKIKSRIIRCFWVSTILLFYSIFLVCGSNKYPESYGVYFGENLNPIKKIEYREQMFFRLNLEELSFADNNSTILVWFYDPKIVPTELKFGRVNYYTNEIENFDFDTKPINGKPGLFKIEITQLIEEGIYALYSYNLIKRSTVPVFLWPFLIVNKKDKSSFKNEILGKWNEPPILAMEFLQNGEIRHQDKNAGNYNFIGTDTLQIVTPEKEKMTFKICFMSNQFLYMQWTEVDASKLLMYRKK